MGAGRAISRIVGISAAVLLLLTGLTWMLQRRLIYLPSPRQLAPIAEALPGAEEVSFATEDGLRLAGWFLPPRGDPPGTTVVVFNGNAGNRSLRAPLARALARDGHAVLLFDYRGYAQNPGRPSEQGLIRDARAARVYLASRTDVDPARVVYFGESLGAAVAVALATERPPAALVLRSPFTSLVDAARTHYPFLPVGLLLKDRWPSLERIARVGAPVLVVVGTRDGIIPPALSRRLYEAAPGPKRLLQIPGADHNDRSLLAGDALVEGVLDFLRDHA